MLNMETDLKTLLLYIALLLAFSKSIETQNGTTADEDEPTKVDANTTVTSTTLNGNETSTLEGTFNSSRAISPAPPPPPELPDDAVTSSEITTNASATSSTTLKSNPEVAAVANEENGNENDTSTISEGAPPQIFTIEPPVRLPSSTASSTDGGEKKIATMAQTPNPPASSTDGGEKKIATMAQTPNPPASSTDSGEKKIATTAQTMSPTASSTASGEKKSTTTAKTPSPTKETIVTSNEIVYNNSRSSSSPDEMANATAADTETEISDATETSAIYLKFTGNCVAKNRTNPEMDFVQFGERDSRECQLTLKVVPVDNREQVFGQLKRLVGKLKIYHDDAPMMLTGTESNFEYASANDTNVPGSNDDWSYVKGLSYNEFVAYVVIGCSFGVLLLTAFCLLCIKCCRCNRKNELRDIPHLSLKLEDYALTRIPRPNTLYSETAKLPIVSDDTSTASVQGQARSTEGQEEGVRISRAYDTGVVPMEEYEYDGHTHYATPSFRNGTQNGKEMRTFRVKNESPTKQGEIEGGMPYTPHDSIVTNSTEKLARDFYRRQATGYGGEENLIYKT